MDDNNLMLIHPTEFMFAEVNGAIELKYHVVNDLDEPVRGQWLLGLESSNKVHMTTVSYSHIFSTSPVVSVVTGGSYILTGSCRFCSCTKKSCKMVFL